MSMSRLAAPKARTIAWSVTALASLTFGCARREPLPNVVVITLDGLRQDHLSFLGYSRPTSPNIDWLAERGRVHRTIVPTSCSTKASLTSLLTSLDYSSHRLIAHSAKLDDDFETLAETFQRHGYATFGAVATPHLSATLGYGQGFDRYADYSHLEEEFVSADRVIGDARDFVGASPAGRPYFLYLHLEEPHPPWIHDSPWVEGATTAARFFGMGCGYIPLQQELDELDPAERYDLVAKYDGAIRFADEQLGTLIALLRARGELDETLIAISTDHGLELLERYSASHGFNPFDEVLKGFLVLFDGRTQRTPLQPFDDLQGRIFDIGPTLLAAAGIPAPAGVDGVDLASAKLPAYAFATCYGIEAVRSREFKLVHFDLRAARKWYRKTHRPVGLPEGFQLFDLRSDAGETRDIGDQRPEIRDRLIRELLRYRERPPKFTTEGGVVPNEERSEEELERLRALGYLG